MSNEIIEKNEFGALVLWASEDNCRDIKPVVEFSLNNDKKSISAIEGCDEYFKADLDYCNITKLINGLKQLRSEMCNVEKAISLFKMYFEMKDKKSKLNNL